MGGAEFRLVYVVSGKMSSWFALWDAQNSGRVLSYFDREFATLFLSHGA